MPGIYIHIPFCKKACHYCNFHFSTSTNGIENMLLAIEKEIILRKDLHHSTINTVYFGGGTPSLIPIPLLNKLLDTIRSKFTLVNDAEITLEANPDDINKINADAWKKAGINRFSIGIQSFFEKDLEWMNRAHNAVQSRTFI
jgi:oxygen-independent coproporphyrinogen-3 oxidase